MMSGVVVGFGAPGNLDVGRGRQGGPLDEGGRCPSGVVVRRDGCPANLVREITAAGEVVPGAAGCRDPESGLDVRRRGQPSGRLNGHRCW